jgi:hypothetical protein
MLTDETCEGFLKWLGEKADRYDRQMSDKNPGRAVVAGEILDVITDITVKFEMLLEKEGG